MIPWPISTFPVRISITPSGLTATQRSRRVLRARLRGREAVVISDGPALAHLLARTADRTQYAIVGTTAAKMDVEFGSDLCVRRQRIAAKQGGRAHYNTSQAVAALTRLLLDEGLLQRVERCTASKPLDRRYGPACDRRHGSIAGLNTAPIQKNSAASTHALSATEPSTLQLEVIAQDVNERGVRVRCDGASCIVDVECDGVGQVQSPHGRLRLHYWYLAHLFNHRTAN